MSKSQSLQRILAQAKEKEKKYDWLGAIEFHKKALDQVLKHKDFLKAGDIEEKIGYCFHSAAMQAGSARATLRNTYLGMYVAAQLQFDVIDQQNLTS